MGLHRCDEEHGAKVNNDDANDDDDEHDDDCRRQQRWRQNPMPTHQVRYCCSLLTSVDVEHGLLRAIPLNHEHMAFVGNEVASRTRREVEAHFSTPSWLFSRLPTPLSGEGSRHAEVLGDGRPHGAKQPLACSIRLGLPKVDASRRGSAHESEASRGWAWPMMNDPDVSALVNDAVQEDADLLRQPCQDPGISPIFRGDLHRNEQVPTCQGRRRRGAAPRHREPRAQQRQAEPRLPTRSSSFHHHHHFHSFGKFWMMGDQATRHPAGKGAIVNKTFWDCLLDEPKLPEG